MLSECAGRFWIGDNLPVGMPESRWPSFSSLHTVAKTTVAKIIRAAKYRAPKLILTAKGIC